MIKVDNDSKCKISITLNILIKLKKYCSTVNCSLQIYTAIKQTLSLPPRWSCDCWRLSVIRLSICQSFCLWAGLLPK